MIVFRIKAIGNIFLVGDVNKRSHLKQSFPTLTYGQSIITRIDIPSTPPAKP